MPGAGAVHHIKAGLEFPRLALFRLTRREKVVEPPKDRSADDAIHQRIDRPGNDRAHAGARTVTGKDGPAQLKKRLPVARPDQVGCCNSMSMEAPHKRPEAIDIAVILSRMLPPFENRLNKQARGRDYGP
jgi:hypothetical protein